MDLLAVVVFVAIGRSVHAHGDSLVGILSTGWPFAVGLGAAWIGLVVRRRDVTSLQSGGLVLVCTVAIGMVLRVVSGQGTAVAFIFVALAFLGAAMFVWRLGAAWARVRHGSAPGS
jgi:hypothetical protein